MRKGKPGNWWVLKVESEPLFWTGELIEATIDGKATILPVHATEAAMAVQYCDRAHAMMAHSLFGLAPTIVAIELTFPALESEGAS